MFEKRENNEPVQDEIWVEQKSLPVAKSSVFYRKLEKTLKKIGFADKVREVCEPAYADEKLGGRPGIDPAVYFKMLMIGFFENLPSERAIAARCEDSLSLRAFLGYELTESTPDHSSLSVIRNRLGIEVYQQAMVVVLAVSYTHLTLPTTPYV